jgi:hypothetical protein
VTVQFIKLIKERKTLTKLRILNAVTFSILLYLTFNHLLVDRVIEKVDWKIFYNKRMDIVNQAKKKELNSNVSWNGVVCELPFKFPVISNGGNDIMIFGNKDRDTLTVTFWTFRNFFSAPSTSFVYTISTEEIKELEKQIADDPDNNWKIQDNWYRTFGE